MVILRYLGDLIAANCVPPGFMVPTGWDIVCKYYQDVDNEEWVPYSVLNPEPLVAASARYEGRASQMIFFAE
jgi:3'-phosphoadenosine 5'-phosphosulfate synthase